MATQKIILGFAGEMASGKGTASKYLVEKYGASSLRFSTMLRDVADRMYLEKSRDNIQRISTMFRQNFGDDLMAKVIAGEARNNENDIVAIDGVRREPDMKYLRELPEFKLVYIETSIENRYERIVKRGENADDANKTFEEFQKDHERETELRIKDLKAKADFVVDNNGTLEQLHVQIDSIVKNCET